MSNPCREYVEMMNGLFSQRTDGMFSPMIRLLLDFGSEMTVKKDALTGTMKMGACYGNATNCMLNDDYRYCEGIALKRGLIPMNHAWLMDSDGHVIDPTWKELDTVYWGIAFKDDFIIEMMDKLEHYGLGDSLYMLRKGPQDVYTLLKDGMAP